MQAASAGAYSGFQVAGLKKGGLRDRSPSVASRSLFAYERIKFLRSVRQNVLIICSMHFGDVVNDTAMTATTCRHRSPRSSAKSTARIFGTYENTRCTFCKSFLPEVHDKQHNLRAGRHDNRLIVITTELSLTRALRAHQNTTEVEMLH